MTATNIPLKTYSPESVHKPLGAYSHALEVPANARLLFLAGQGGRRPDGTRPQSIEGQAEQTWRNILNILEAADMGAENVVRVTTYVTSASFRDATGAARAQALGSVRPASTLIVVAALVMPDMLIEIDVVAAKA